MQILTPVRGTRRQCYVCFKKYHADHPLSQTRTCSQECGKQYENIKKINRTIARKERQEL